jgi:hypothetical protein
LVAGALFAPLLLLPSRVFAQTGIVRVCVSEVNGNNEDPDDPQIQAKRLAKVLSGREIEGSETLQPVVMSETHSKAVRARIEKEGCAYLVRIWQRSQINDDGGDSPAMHAPIRVQNQDALVFELRDSNTNKVICSGQAPPYTIYAKQGRRVYDPFPTIADKIVSKLSQKQ